MSSIFEAIYEDCYLLLKTKDISRINKFINNLDFLLNDEIITKKIIENNKIIYNFLSNNRILLDSILQLLFPKSYARFKMGSFCITRTEIITYNGRIECSDESSSCWWTLHPHTEYKEKRLFDGERLAVKVLNQVAREYFNHNCIKFKIINIDFNSNIYKDHYSTYGGEKSLVSTDAKYEIKICFEVNLYDCYSYGLIKYIKKLLKEISDEIRELHTFINDTDNRLYEFKEFKSFQIYVQDRISSRIDKIIPKLEELCNYFHLFRHQPSLSQ